MDFAIQADHTEKLKESEKRDKYQDLAGELKNLWNMSDTDTNNNNSHQMTGTGTGGLENKRMRGDHPNYSIVEINQNPEKSPGDRKRLAVT